MKALCKLEHKAIAPFIIWLFHISAIIGITLGFQEWFISLTPLNLSILMLLTVIYFPIRNKRAISIFLLFIILGFFAEWVGVNYDFLFGVYIYGDNLGPKLGGVPYFIGINWAILTFVTAAISSAFFKKIWLKIVFSSLLMVFLDYFMETSAPIFDFWYFDLGYAPLQNYIAWFLIASLLQFIFHLSKISGAFTFSLHLYVAQLVFFIYFHVFYSL